MKPFKPTHCIHIGRYDQFNLPNPFIDVMRGDTTEAGESPLYTKTEWRNASTPRMFLVTVNGWDLITIDGVQLSTTYSIYPLD